MMDITQEQMLDVVRPLLEYIGVDAQDVSKIEVTASQVSVTRANHWGQHETIVIEYTGGN